MLVKDIMTKTVATVNAEDTVERAATLMKEHNIGSVPVCNNEKVIGIITDRDITTRSVSEGENVHTQTVRQIMTSNPVLGKPDMDIQDAARIMSERQIRRLPIVEGENLVGVVSLGDMAVEPGVKNRAGDTLCNISEPACPDI